jgi:gas vesicle protein
LKKTDYVTLFVAGAGIGLAASLLLARESGGKTRRRIRDAANKAGDLLKKRAEEVGASSNEILDDYGLSRQERKKTVSDLQEKARDKTANAVDAAKSAAKRAREKAEDMAHVVGEKIEVGS